MENVTVFSGSTLPFDTQAGILCAGFLACVIVTLVFVAFVFQLIPRDAMPACFSGGGSCCLEEANVDCENGFACVCCRWIWYSACPQCCVDCKRRMRDNIEERDRLMAEEMRAAEIVRRDLDEQRKRQEQEEEHIKRENAQRIAKLSDMDRARRAALQEAEVERAQIHHEAEVARLAQRSEAERKRLEEWKKKEQKKDP